MNLAVILSDRCNLLCRYCAVRLNVGPAHYLEGARLRRGIDHYLDGAEKNRRSVTYLGGEPLLKPAVVRDAVLHVRRRAPDCRQYLYTNGLLLTRPIYEFLAEHDVGVILSFDGEKKANDLFRVTYRRPGVSAWDAVMRRLEGLPLDKLGVHMVFTPETASGLVENLDFLRRTGFGRIGASPDVSDIARLAAWRPEAVERLRRASRRLGSYLAGLTDGEEGRFEFTPLMSGTRQNAPARRSKLGREFESLLLGADGRYYPCETLLPWPYEQLGPRALGDAESGIDRRAQAALNERARAYVARAFPAADFYSCPLKIYVAARHARREPAPLIRGMIRVFDAFYRPHE